MNPTVFECPLCRAPFQAVAEMAGVAVQCPNCRGAIQLPEFPAAKPVTTPPAKAAIELAAVESCDCPKCRRAFGYTREMVGITIACPHCTERFVLQPESATRLNAEAETAAQLGLAPESQRNRFRGYRPVKPTPGVPLPTPSSYPRTANLSGNDGLAETVASSQEQLFTPDSPQADVKTPNDQVTRVLDPASLSESDAHDSGEIRVSQAATKARPEDLNLLLPPKFYSRDPSIIRQRRSNEGNFVLLPTAEGGYQRVNAGILKIEHRGESILLVAPDRRKLRRRRILVNLITVAICATVLYLAVRWLLS